MTVPSKINGPTSNGNYEPIVIDVTKKNRRQLIALVTISVVWLMFIMFFSISGYSLVNYMSRIKAGGPHSEPPRKAMILTMTSDNGTEVQVELSPIEELVYLASQHEELSRRNLTAEFLRRFLVSRKNNPEKALEVVLGYFQMRRDHPEFFMMATESLEKVDPPLFYFQKERGPNGEPLAYSKMANWDYNKHTFSYAMAAITPFVEIGTMENLDNSRKGGITIVDMRDWSWSHTWNAKGDGKLVFQLTEGSLPIMPGMTHICYESSFVSIVFNAFKFFMSEEMKSKIRFHGSNLESLYEYVPRHLLPVELGGDKNLTRFSMVEAKRIDKKLQEYYQRWPLDV